MTITTAAPRIDDGDKWADVNAIFQRDGGVNIGDGIESPLALQLLAWEVMDLFGYRAAVSLTSDGRVRARRNDP